MNYIKKLACLGSLVLVASSVQSMESSNAREEGSGMTEQELKTFFSYFDNLPSDVWYHVARLLMARTLAFEKRQPLEMFYAGHIGREFKKVPLSIHEKEFFSLRKITPLGAWLIARASSAGGGSFSIRREYVIADISFERAFFNVLSKDVQEYIKKRYLASPKPDKDFDDFEMTSNPAIFPPIHKARDNCSIQ